ncbi:hypothetical protein EKN99_20940 [Enterobacter hormaechei]|nr:hypothetical protein EKN99_20940 [Enterobacter hormaechei]
MPGGAALTRPTILLGFVGRVRRSRHPAKSSQKPPPGGFFHGEIWRVARKSGITNHSPYPAWSAYGNHRITSFISTTCRRAERSHRARGLSCR